jgi:hypothetical protein
MCKGLALGIRRVKVDEALEDGPDRSSGIWFLASLSTFLQLHQKQAQVVDGKSKLQNGMASFEVCEARSLWHDLMSEP